MTENGIELIESYVYYYPDSLSDHYIKHKGDILELKNIRDQKKYRGTYFELRISRGSFRAESTVRETFEREEQLVLKGKKLDVIVFNNALDVSARHKYIPFLVESISLHRGKLLR